MPSCFDPGRVPNPFLPIAPREGAELGQRRSLQRQRVRRAEILASTRRLLAAGGEQFTLKRVSDECGVTVQTIRNSFGRREDLLVCALNEHTTAVWRALVMASQGPGLFLDLADMYYHCATATPGFLRGMVTAAIADTQTLSVLQRHGAALKIAYLRDLARGRWLRPGADAEALAAQITRLNTFMIYEWAMGGEAGELRHQMLSGNRLLLQGALAEDSSAGSPWLSTSASVAF